MRSLAVVAGVIGDATAGTVMTRAGEPLPLPGTASHPLLAAGSALLPVAAAELARLAQTSFLCPYKDPDTDARLVRVSVLASPSGLPDHLAAIVLISPAVGLLGLTPRELEIMALLVQGWTTPRIAAGLFVAERTVATHLEHILAKVDVTTRAAAAVMALRLGLYIPHQLTAPPHR